MNKFAHPALPIPGPGIRGGRPWCCGRWGSASRPSPGAGWRPLAGSSAGAPAGPGGASACPAAAQHLGLAGQARRVRGSLASIQGSPGPPLSRPHHVTHATSEECCVQWLPHRSGCQSCKNMSGAQGLGPPKIPDPAWPMPFISPAHWCIGLVQDTILHSRIQRILHQ